MTKGLGLLKTILDTIYHRWSQLNRVPGRGRYVPVQLTKWVKKPCFLSL